MMRAVTYIANDSFDERGGNEKGGHSLEQQLPAGPTSSG